LAADERCPTCNQKIKHEHEGPTGPKRSRFTVAEPPGEEGVLEDLLIQFVERLKPTWDGDGYGAISVGDRTWKYRGSHAGFYAMATAPQDSFDRLFAMETGG
jgi:hypothetical protein